MIGLLRLGKGGKDHSRIHWLIGVAVLWLSSCSPGAFDEAKDGYQRALSEPKVVQIQTINNTTTDLVFNIPINVTSASDLANYSISRNGNPLTINSVTVLSNKKVRLTTDPQQQLLYDLRISKISSTNGFVQDGYGTVFAGDGVPYVAQVTTTEADGQYSAGDSLTVEVVFSEKIVLSGSMDLIIENFTGDKTISSTSSSGDRVYFVYNVAAADESTSFRYKNASAMSLTGSLTDTNGNVADLTLPVPGSTGSLSDNRNIALNNTFAPSVTSPGGDRTDDQRPTWDWSPNGGTGNGTFRYRLQMDDSGTLSTIEPWTTTASTTYTPGSDLTLERDYIMSVQEQDDAGNWSTSGQYTVTVVTAPYVNFTVDSQMALEDSGSVTVELSLSFASTNDLDIPIELDAASTALAGADHDFGNQTVTIPASLVTKSFSFSLTDDVLDENSETVILNIGTPPVAFQGTTYPSQTISIFDNDLMPNVEFAAATKSVDEDAGTATVTIQLDSASGRDVDIDYLVAGGTATEGAGNDYTITGGPSGSVTIPAGSTSKDLTINLNDENLYELDETIELEIQNPIYASLGGQTTHTFTINNEDTKPEVNFQASTGNGTESATPVTVTVQLDKPAGVDTQINFAIDGGTTTAEGGDYALATTNVTIPEGSDFANVDILNIIDDNIHDDATEDVGVQISATGGNATVGASDTYVYTINDNDTPTIQFTAVSSSANEDSAGTVDVEVSLTGISDYENDISVDYQDMATGTAVNPDDFDNLSSVPVTMTFAATAGMDPLQQNISFDVVDDSGDPVYEPDETVVIGLSNAVNATMGANTTHTFTITNDEPVPTISITDINPNEGSGGGNNTVTLTVDADVKSYEDIDIDYSSAGSGATPATAGTDFTSVSGTGTIIAGTQTFDIDVDVAQDDLDEFDETFDVTLDAVSSGTATIAANPDDTGTVTIADDDPLPDVELSIAPTSGDEDIGTFDVTATITSVPNHSGRNIAVNLSYGGTANNGGGYPDYTGVTPMTITSGSSSQTQPIAINDDSWHEVAETIEVSVDTIKCSAEPATDCGTDVTATPPLTYTINVDLSDTEPTVYFDNSSPVSISEGNVTFSIDIELSTVAGIPITIPFTVTPDTAAGGGTDYDDPVPLDVTFAPGDTSKPVQIDIKEDFLDEGNESFDLELNTTSGSGSFDSGDAIPGSGGAAEPLSRTITINDDDTAGVSIGPASFTIDEDNDADGTPRSRDYSIVLDSHPGTGNSVTVQFTVSDTAVAEVTAWPANCSYTSPTGECTFDDSNWNTAANITVQSIDDDVDEGSTQTLTIDHTISATTGMGYSGGVGDIDNPAINVTVDDGDDNAGFAITETGGVTSVVEGDEGAGSQGDTYDVALTSEPESGQTVTLNLSDSGTDLNYAPASLNFDPGNWDVAQTVTVTGIADFVGEGGTEVVTVDHAITTGDTKYSALADPTLSVNVMDTANDSIIIMHDDGKTEINEDGTAPSSDTIYVRLVGTGLGGSDTVEVTMSGQDLSFVPNVINLDDSNWDTPQSVTVEQAANDSIYEPSNLERIKAEITATTGTHPYSSGDSKLLDIIVNDDDAPPVLSFSNQTFNETDGTVNIPVTLTGSTEVGDVTVDCTTLDNTASQGEDFSALTTANLTWPVESDGVQNCVLDITDDNIDEPDQNFQIQLTNETNASIGGGATKTMTITGDDDAHPDVTSISFVGGGCTFPNIDEGDNSCDAQVTLNRRSQHGAITVTWDFSGSSASASDYTINDPITVANNSLTGQENLSLTADSLYEPGGDETIVFDIASVTSGSPDSPGSFTGATKTVQVVDQDAQPTLVIDTAAATADSLENVTAVTIPVDLSHESSQPITVDFVLGGTSTSGAGNDYTYAPTGPDTLTFNAGDLTQNISITVLDDSSPEDDETIDVTIQNPTNSTLGATTNYIYTIKDNDRVGPDMTNVEYHDTDNNGKLDHAKLVFDMNVDDSSFNIGEWAIAGYGGLAHDSTAGPPINDVANDDTLWISFTEGSGYDTGATPDITAAPTLSLTEETTRTIKCYADVSPANADCQTPLSTTQITAVEFDESSSDNAAPIITKISAETGTDKMSVFFSEAVDADGSAGGCNTSLDDNDLDYGKLDVAGTWADTDACDSRIHVTTNTTLTAADINSDTIQAINGAVFDMNDNPVDNSTNYSISYARSPYILDATSSDNTTVKVFFSEAVLDTEATNIANYTIAENPADGSCVNVDTVTSVNKITDSIYEIVHNNAQCSGTGYRISAATIHDLDETLMINGSSQVSFAGAQALRLLKAESLSNTTTLLYFNKDVASGAGAGGSEDANRYKMIDRSDSIAVSGAVRDPVRHNEVTLTHTDLDAIGGGTDQSMVLVIASNGIDNDGFDDSGFGAIQIDGGGESLQDVPFDRFAMQYGGGSAIDSFAGGEFAGELFGKGGVANFRYKLFSYRNRLYAGLNPYANGLFSFDPLAQNGSISYLTILNDTMGGSQSANSAGGPFGNLGRSGCTANSNDLLLGCGPDNEDDFANIFALNDGGSEALLASGGHSGGDNNYIYYSNTGPGLQYFSYVDMNDALGPINDQKGVDSAIAHNSRIYLSYIGGNGNHPYVLKLLNTNAESAAGVDNQYLSLNYMTGFGANSMTKPVNADMAGAAMTVYLDKIYMANSGFVDPACATGQTFPTCSNDTGLIRSTNNDPSSCTAPDTCADWLNATPSDGDFAKYFSIVPVRQLGSLSAERPIAKFAQYKGKLYLIRNACNENVTGPGGGDDITCPSGQHRPQLWKCTHGGDNTCDPMDWSLVADNGGGYTDFGNSNNTAITLLETNGDYLYIGFDNATDGVQIHRTNAADPSVEGDFSHEISSGFGNAAMNKVIYSSTSTQQDLDYYIYVTTGKNDSVHYIYRQKNQ